jgi:hypothetical protein
MLTPFRSSEYNNDFSPNLRDVTFSLCYNSIPKYYPIWLVLLMLNLQKQIIYELQAISSFLCIYRDEMDVVSVVSVPESVFSPQLHWGFSSPVSLLHSTYNKIISSIIKYTPMHVNCLKVNWQVEGHKSGYCITRGIAYQWLQWYSKATRAFLEQIS